MKFKVKDNSKNISVVLSIGLNILFYILVIMFTLFTTSFNFDNLLPRWELWTALPELLQGFWPWQKGIISAVPEGTAGAYWQPGVLVLSGVIQILGYMFFINTKWGRKLKLTLESVYLRNTKILSKYRYLISDDKFRLTLKTIDLQNKRDTWRLLIQERLQKLQDKMPKQVLNELMNPPEHQGKRTKRWLSLESRLKLQLTDKWIDDNIYRIKIKYPRINVRMVVNGVTDIDIARMAITDIKLIETKENMNKAVWALLSFTLVSLFTAIGFVAFRQDIWMLIKDFVVYTISLVMNIVMGILSANEVHEARIRETEDRKGYIEMYVGHDTFKQIEKEVDSEINKSTINNLENELRRIKSTINNDNDNDSEN